MLESMKMLLIAALTVASCVAQSAPTALGFEVLTANTQSFCNGDSADACTVVYQDTRPSPWIIAPGNQVLKISYDDSAPGVVAYQVAMVTLNSDGLQRWTWLVSRNDRQYGPARQRATFWAIPLSNQLALKEITVTALVGAGVAASSF